MFSRAKTGLLRLLRKRDIKLYSDIKRKSFIREKYFTLNYSIPTNSKEDSVELLRMHKRQKQKQKQNKKQTKKECIKEKKTPKELMIHLINFTNSMVSSRASQSLIQKSTNL